MKTNNLSLFVAAGLTAALYQPLASAAEPVQNYLNTRYGGTVMSGSGECVRTSDKVTEYREDCGYEMVLEKDTEVDSGATGTAVTITESAAIVKGDKVYAAAAVIEEIIINNVQFEFDSAKITPEYAAMLDEASDLLKPHRAQLRQGLAQLNVIGYTDSVGSESYNKALSERRAKAVADYLIQQDPSRAAFIQVIGRGEADPIADNSTEEGRAQNRRTALQVVGK
jgi:outer membrane protein OmpA-like peptidoglycan-associated protein